MIMMDGKAVAALHRAKIKKQVQSWVQSGQRAPGLAVVLVGEDPASQVYVRNKGRSCEEVGFASWIHALPKETTRESLKAILDELNRDSNVDGILVQLPLPKHLDPDEVSGWISPLKDADGLTVENTGLLWSGRPRVKPCTPWGVMSILDHYNIHLGGKEAVVVGRSHIVGKPMAYLLQEANATVTLCHSKTKDLVEHTRRADIVVVAAGQPRLLGREDFKAGSVVVDVGIHRDPSGSSTNKPGLCGDVRFSELNGWVYAATPVPGGVGPMTITMLLENTLHLYKLHMGLAKA